MRGVLNSPAHVDEAPATVYAKLLDEGIYLASVSDHVPDPAIVTTRCASGAARPRHPAHKKPELIATAPNSVWSWDITKLLGPAKWTYFYLYVIVDIFSRYVPGWMLARSENAGLAEALLADTVAKQGIEFAPAHHPRRSRIADDRQAGGASCSPTSVSPRATAGPM